MRYHAIAILACAARLVAEGPALQLGFAALGERPALPPALVEAGIEIGASPFDAVISLAWGPMEAFSAKIEGSFEAVSLDGFRASGTARASLNGYGEGLGDLRAGTGALLAFGPKKDGFRFEAGAWMDALWSWARGIPTPLFDWDPGASIGFLYGFSDGGELGLAIRKGDYSALWLKTSIEFSALLLLGRGAELRLALGLDYTDIFTLTAYMEGLRFSASLSLPLGVGGEGLAGAAP
jgi:hypothetical protein